MSPSAVRNKIDVYVRLTRLHKPIGILLLLWPTLWALLIAGNGKPDWFIVSIFISGTVLMRSAGCVMNDIADHKFDGHVKRTRTRPIPNGDVSKKEAYLLAAVLSLIAFVLVIQLNVLTVKLSLLALFLAITYPFTKRFFAIPQAYLGIAFGFGIPMAFAAIHHAIPAVAWPMLLANVTWAIAYDTEYAMVDRDDDLKIGIRSSAITFGRYDIVAVMICYAATIMLLGAVGTYLAMGVYFYSGLLLAAMTAIHHYTLIKQRDRDRCFKAFTGNNWFGFFIFAGMLAHYLCAK